MLDWIVSALRPHWFRGKGRLLNAIAPAQGTRQASVFGAQMTLDLGEAIQRNVYLGTFEPSETRFARQWLKPGMTFVDVGANIGYFTALAASRVGPTGRVLALEPSPRAFGTLQRMIEENALRSVTAMPVAVSSAPGERLLYIAPDERGLHSPTMTPVPDSRPVPVQVSTLDACLEEWGVDQVDLMKIDIEGHEVHAFQGARRTLERGGIRALLCEFNDYWLRASGGSPAELLRLLVDAGFECTTTPTFVPHCVVTYGFVHKRR